MKFIFDLDGTITKQETLPIISKHFSVDEEISALTKQTIKGDIPFIESFIKRIHILGDLPVSAINDLLAEVPLSPKVVKFIQTHKQDCVIATGNFSGWVEKIANKIGCQYFSSDGIVKDNKIVKLTKILKKEDIVSNFKAQGESVVFIGDGNNDVAAMRGADIAIACGLVHKPAKSVLTVADYVVFDENSLHRLLTQIQTPQKGKSLVISCAGIGSRLGLGQTKALIKIAEKPLIHHQLASFKNVEDVRIVIGFQATEVIKTVLEKRKDVIFVYNHDYFHTKTGASYYLGARHSNEYAIAWDGDLLVHPNDIQKCLNYDGEFVGCSETVSDEPIFVRINENNGVVSFSKDNGQYEWSGPACLKRNNIQNTSGHVFSQIEKYLPLPALVVKAQDIDTYDDYKKAIQFMQSWNGGNKNIGSYYGKMAEKITDPTETRNKAKDFSQYDIDLMRRISDKNKTLLDLGAGTGLLVNHLEKHFKKIVAVEKHPNFSKFIHQSEIISVVNMDLLELAINTKFDYVSLFGVMNFFNNAEAKSIYKKIRKILNDKGTLIVKNQMGIAKDVIINGYSAELNADYYSMYRQVDGEIDLLHKIGFNNIDKIDIYPAEFNRWTDTHFYALVCRK